MLLEVARRGITLRCRRIEDLLRASPKSRLTPELVVSLKEHKLEIIEIMREDERLRETGILQSERQVFDLARDYFREKPRRERSN